MAPLEFLHPDDTRAPSVNHIVKRAQYLKINHESFEEIRSGNIDFMTLNLPVGESEFIELNLYKVDILAEGFVLTTSGEPNKAIEYNSPKHYRGTIKGDPHSIAAFSFLENEVMGIIGTKNGNIVIGKSGKSKDRVHIIYNDRDLQDENDFECGTQDDGRGYTLEELSENYIQRDVGDCVKLYIEIDDDIVTQKGGAIPATDYITGLFNESITLYANDNIEMEISEIKAWTTSAPYNGGSSNVMLTSFQNNTGTFNGDIAQLVSYQASGGIAAGFAGICNANPDESKCFSSIDASYSLVPTYSWSVMVTTHEMGHLLGSLHTHACVWNGNNTAIDGCSGSTEGSCALPGNPAGGGTIMSYCHLTSAGINFTQGFGDQPGNVIRNNIAAPNCLEPCAPPTPDNAGISDIITPDGTLCTTSSTPEVVLKNYGSNALSSVTINYQVDGATAQSISWSGSLATGSTTNVTLPSVSFGQGSHTFTAYTSNPNGTTDTNSANDSRSNSFASGTNDATLTITFDNYPEETTWDIRDGSNNIIASGGPYGSQPDQSTLIIPVPCLPSACFDFTIYDTYGDGICCQYGSGSYELKEDASGTVLANGGSFGSSETTDFCVPAGLAPLAISIISTSDETCTGMNDGSATGLATGGTESYSYVWSNGASGATASNLTAGIYSVTVDDGSSTASTSVEIFNLCGCVPLTTDFAPGDNPLVHQGSGSTSAILGFTAESEDASFTINGLDQKLNGNPSNRYIDLVTVRYVNSNGVQFYGTYSGADQNSVSVSITGDISSVEIELSDAYDGDTGNKQISVSMTTVDYCGTDSGCQDFDNDGICDVDDNCLDVQNPGQEDADNNGIGDACEDTGCVNPATNELNPNPLTHTGGGADQSTVSFGTPVVTHADISFTISNINQKLNGKASRKYKDKVTVTYVDENSSTVTYGTWNGSPSTVDVTIALAKSVTVTLEDGLDGTLEEGTQSIDFSSVTSCEDLPPLLEGVRKTDAAASDEIGFLLYPNPTTGSTFIKFESTPSSARIIVRDVLGRVVEQYQVGEQELFNMNLSKQLPNQMYLVTVEIPNQKPVTMKLLLVN